MTYDELYEHVVNYVAMPHTTITEHDHRRSCLILGAFMEFIMDCTDAGIDPRTLDMNGFVSEKLDELDSKCDMITSFPRNLERYRRDYD